MNNQEQFTEFLSCCKAQKVKRIYLTEIDDIYHSNSGDFGGIVLEFEDCMYFLTSKYLDGWNEDTIDELCAKKITDLADMQNEITEGGIYKILSFPNGDITFVTELIDEDGYFRGMEFETSNYFLFFNVCSPIIVVCAERDDAMRYYWYPHQFDGTMENTREIDERSYVALFP